MESKTNLTEKEMIEKFGKIFQLKYKKELLNAARHFPDVKSVYINFEDIEKYDFKLAEELINNPQRIINTATKAAKLIYSSFKEEVNISIRFTNLPVTTKIGELGRSLHISKLVQFEGVMVSLSEIKQRCVMAAFECKYCNHIMFIPIEEKDQSIKQPSLCDSCGKKTFKHIIKESIYKDIQVLQIQEHFETSKGTQPRQIKVIAEDDLTLERTWGSSIKVSGILDIYHDIKNGKRNKDAKKYVIGNYIKCNDELSRNCDFSPEDILKIKELAKDPKICQKIINSIAPHIIGLNQIKEGVGLWLFGAPPEKLPDGNTQRGDSHILLIGDPATAKSDILDFIETNFKVIKTSGPGTTKVGLSAAAVRDTETGEWTLRAGPLVFADGWLCLIDGFEKMRDEDRDSLHEPMEQQKVSISKAGIVSNFRARCGIMAAANPKSGRFDEYKSLIEQFNIPDTILSRFDLIYVLQDTPEHDKEIAQSILNTIVYTPEINLKLLLKYVIYARQNINPVLSDKAKKYLEEYYIHQREILINVQDAPIPITPHQLLGLKRLVKARARQRLSKTVSLEDAKAVIKLFDYTLKTAGIGTVMK